MQLEARSLCSVWYTLLCSQSKSSCPPSPPWQWGVSKQVTVQVETPSSEMLEAKSASDFELLKILEYFYVHTMMGLKPKHKIHLGSIHS